MATSSSAARAARYPEHPLDLPHSGGTMPFLLSRFRGHEIDMKEKAARAMPRA